MDELWELDLLLNYLERESGLMILSLASTVSASNELAAANIISNDLADSAILCFFNRFYLNRN